MSAGSAATSTSMPFSEAKRPAMPIVGRGDPSGPTRRWRRPKAATAVGDGVGITTGGGITSRFSRTLRKSGTLSA